MYTCCEHTKIELHAKKRFARSRNADLLLKRFSYAVSHA